MFIVLLTAILLTVVKREKQPGSHHYINQWKTLIHPSGFCDKKKWNSDTQYSLDEILKGADMESHVAWFSYISYSTEGKHGGSHLVIPAFRKNEAEGCLRVWD